MTTHIPHGAVVVGVDGSTHERWAVDWGARKAAAERRPLVLLHVVDPRAVGFAQEAEHAARRGRRECDTRRAQEAYTDLEISTVIDHGDPRAVLLQHAGSATHLVVGSRGRGPVASLLLGSVSAAVARHAPCPVTVVRPYHPGLVRRGVLVGVDDSPESRTVLEHAFQEASERGQPLTVRHCRWDVVASVTDPHLVPDTVTDVEDDRRLVAQAVAGFRERYPDVAVTTEVARGAPEHTLVADSRRTDLLVVGRHPHSRAERVLRTAVATAVVERAECPVLVVPLDVAVTAATRSGHRAR